MTSKIILGAIIAVAFVAGTITIGTLAFAEDDKLKIPISRPNPGQPFEQIIFLLSNPHFGLEEIKNEVRNIENMVEEFDPSSLETIETTVISIDEEVTNIEAKLDDSDAGLAAIKKAIDNIETGGIADVTVTNDETNPIPVTGIISSNQQVSGLQALGVITFDGCTNESPLGINWKGEPDKSPLTGDMDGFIVQASITESSFTADGIYIVMGPGCALGSRELPGVFTLTGDCGEGATVELTTDRGSSGTFTGNVACVP